MRDSALVDLILRVLATPEVIVTAIAFVILSLFASYIANPPAKRKFQVFTPRPKKAKPVKAEAPPEDGGDEEDNGD